MLRISFSFLAQYTTLLKKKFILKKSVYTHDKQPQYHNIQHGKFEVRKQIQFV